MRIAAVRQRTSAFKATDLSKAVSLDVASEATVVVDLLANLVEAGSLVVHDLFLIMALFLILSIKDKTDIPKENNPYRVTKRGTKKHI